MTQNRYTAAREFTKLNIETAENILTLHQDGKNAYRKEQIEGSLECYKTILSALEIASRLEGVDVKALQDAIGRIGRIGDYRNINGDDWPVIEKLLILAIAMIEAGPQNGGRD